jgi:glycosyltransferase involved in cell wall biosynthesis
MANLIPPDIAYPLTGERFDFRPSWARESVHLGPEHEAIFEQTKTLPGWQDPPDSKKLYEMAHYCGAVILEIGMFGGRSAVIELKGALAGAAAREGSPVPQYFGVDVSLEAVNRTHDTLCSAGVERHALLYHGELSRFLNDLPITPSMVFVDGDHRYPGVWADLNTLRRILPEGTPVYCHDFNLHPEGVGRAVHEAVDAGWFRIMGRFAGAVLLAATPGRALRHARGLSADCFAAMREALLERYREAGTGRATPPPMWTDAADLTREARAELATKTERRMSSGRAGWPYVNPEPPLPAAMPDGRPWPRITVVTPSFRQGKYIEETILSVRNQGYPNVEHIVIDGGSKDETVEVVNRYLDGIAYFVSEKDKGQSDAINKGFARATGEIYTWINSDDMLAPGALAAAAMAFNSSGADLVNGICRVYTEGELTHQCLSSVDTSRPLPLDDLLDIENCWMKGEFWFQPDVMFTRALWEKAGAKVEVGWYYSMDYELWVRFAQAGAKVHVIGRPLCWFRAHAEQKTAEAAAPTGEGQKAAPAKAEPKGFHVELPKVREAVCAAAGKPWVPREHPPVKNRLRVAFFNDLGFQYGAGIAHRRLAETLASAGHTVKVFSAATTTPFLEKPRHTSRAIVDRIGAFKPDLVVLGNLHGADIEPAVLERITANFETIFVLHDLWLFTGRCTYTGGCEKYLTGCGPACTCPAGYPVMPPEAVRPAWDAKRRILSHSPRLTVMGNSRWMLDRAREAFATLPERHRPATDWVKFGFDLETLRPRDKRDCREALGLPQDRFIVMSSAASLSDERKGLSHLAEAMRLLRLPDAMVASVGWFKPGQEPPIPGMRALGYMKDPVRLAMLYSAADIFVGASLEEAFGQVYIEAAACGTPAVGYPVGGVPEAIADGVTGRLAAEVSPEALADVIDELYRNGARRLEMGRSGRIHVENEWSRAAAMHQFHTALQRTGVAARAGLSRKIDFTRQTEVPEPVSIAPTEPGYRPLWGLEHFEPPNEAKNLGRHRWAVGPSCGFEVKAEKPGAARLVLGCRSLVEGQRVRLVHKSEVVGERDVPASPHSDQMLAFDVKLDPGLNTFELHHWKWKLGEGRSTALLVTSLNVVPLG